MNEVELTLEKLSTRVTELRREWFSKEPFHYLVIDDVLTGDFAEAILQAYPPPEAGGWDNTTYLHQRHKSSRTKDFLLPIEKFFALTASPEFRRLMSEITGIPQLLADPDLTGGGLHQISCGGFLDVHVDYNFHPKTKLHRRLNLLVYLNKDWKAEYQGCLELWDMAARRQLENIAPVFNRGVIFETNEISYHGHPQPLKTPPQLTRKSLAIYYYTAEREAAAVAPEHNTLYQQTTGASGYVKTALAGAQAALERVRTSGVEGLSSNLLKRSLRRIKGLPPENK
ncbi:MAG: 2OG-Fe(II) oxygenase [Acidobacteria bacterium]|nr:2OG-Fe(II) oxygenase [Acidobacteriota bacterium]MBI3421411.1 2OG-Fe(II) oxygenase [Acidobacteriota bacterium]